MFRLFLDSFAESVTNRRENRRVSTWEETSLVSANRGCYILIQIRWNLSASFRFSGLLTSRRGIAWRSFKIRILKRSEPVTRQDRRGKGKGKLTDLTKVTAIEIETLVTLFVTNVGMKIGRESGATPLEFAYLPACP